MMVSVTQREVGYAIHIDDELVATIIAENEGWTSSDLKIPIDLLDFIVDYLDDQGRL